MFKNFLWVHNNDFEYVYANYTLKGNCDEDEAKRISGDEKCVCVCVSWDPINNIKL